MTDEEFEKIVELFCDKFCRYPRTCADQDILKEQCDKCPICKLEKTIEKLEKELSKYKSSESGAEKVRMMADIRSSEALKSVLTVIPEEQFLFALADELVKKGWTRSVKKGDSLYTVAFGKVDEVNVTYAYTETTLEVRAGDKKLTLCDFKDGEGFYTDKKAAERELLGRRKDESI